ncbi:hypothetical protein VP01_951g7 [Puccinia sorghi]|uniref:Uncharacterized protein n=1 Tax=Puccinia sorghi TaxID=27349 RepID=A0A0L6U6X3_9BASI|nr:hypothetical protein VP01_951g7 [Puccinia sorghi]
MVSISAVYEQVERKNLNSSAMETALVHPVWSMPNYFQNHQNKNPLDVISTMSLIYVLIIPLSSMTQPNTPRSRIKNQILFLMQITVHEKLSSVVDKYTSATIQIKFQGTMCFCRFDLFDKLFDLKTAPPPTNLQALQVLFNKISEWLSNLGKFSTTIPPLVELLFLKILVLPPPKYLVLRSFRTYPSNFLENKTSLLVKFRSSLLLCITN